MLHLTVFFALSPSAAIGPTPQNRAMFRPSSGKRLPVRPNAQEQIVVLKVGLLFPSWNTRTCRNGLASVESSWLAVNHVHGGCAGVCTSDVNARPKPV